MGIALVVILIIIGIVYLAKYSAEPPKKTQQDFQRRELPKTIITSLVEVVSTCNDEKMADVIQDCGFGSLTCASPIADGAGGVGVGSCDYLKITLKQILDTMLGRFQYNYQLRLLSQENDLLDGAVKSAGFDPAACQIFETAAQPLLNDRMLELKVCY